MDIRIKLPITSDGEPDWQYMGDYIKSLNINLSVTKNSSTNKEIDFSNQGYFYIADIFDSFQIGKANYGMLLDGSDCIYLGAKKSNNGVMRFCKRDDTLIHGGNCIAFICDGQGPVGFNNYIPFDFIGTINLSLGYSKYLNQYTGLFLVTILDKERFRFSFGRKRKPTLKETLIKLPTTLDNNIDWQFMEDYIKYLPYGDCL